MVAQPDVIPIIEKSNLTKCLRNGVTEMLRRLNFTVVWRILWAGSRRIIDMQIRSVGIDLGKTTFHLVALGDKGKVLLKKKFTRGS